MLNFALLTIVIYKSLLSIAIVDDIISKIISSRDY